MAQTTVPVYLTGKVGSVVYTGNRQGTAVRQLVTPKNPSTPVQTLQRQRFSAAAKAWAGLAQASKLTWKTFAATLANNLSSFNAFVKVYITALIVGDAAPTAAPSSVAIPNVSLSALTATVNGSGVASLDLTLTAATAPDFYIYRSSGPKSAGVSATPQCDVILVTAGSSPATATALGAAWVTKYGTPSAGQKTFIQVQAVEDDVEGTKQTVSAIFATAS